MDSHFCVISMYKVEWKFDAASYFRINNVFKLSV